MTTNLDDHELDALLRAADPVDIAALDGASRSPAAAQLRATITSRERASGARTVRRRRWAVLAGAVAAAVALPVALTLARPSSSESAYGAQLVRFAANSPRLLVAADGWQVTRADEQDDRTGEMTFAKGTASLDVFWVAGADGKESDKASLTASGSALIDGEQAWVGRYPSDSSGLTDFEAIWSVGDQAREARGTFPTRAAFLAVAQTLHRVDVDSWLDAMPASVINPGSRTATVEQMLADIPQPEGFDAAALEGTDLVMDRYQVGSQVTGAVSCAWVRQWSHGDPAQRAEAARAMATSRHWAVLRDMAAQGGWSQVVWMVADDMNGHPFTKGPNNSMTLEQWTRSALGC